MKKNIWKVCLSLMLVFAFSIPLSAGITPEPLETRTLSGDTETVENRFKDVSPDNIHYDAVQWVYENRVMTGYGTGIFAPDDSISRESFASVLYRYTFYAGLVFEPDSTITCSDIQNTSAWAKESVEWALYNGILKTDANNFLYPRKVLTLGEMLEAYDAFFENINDNRSSRELFDAYAFSDTETYEGDMDACRNAVNKGIAFNLLPLTAGKTSDGADYYIRSDYKLSDTVTRSMVAQSLMNCDGSNTIKTENGKVTGYTGNQTRVYLDVSVTSVEDGVFEGTSVNGLIAGCDTEIKAYCEKNDLNFFPVHNEIVDEGFAATCTEPGKTEGKHCSVCGDVMVAQETISSLGHTEVIDKAVDATCATEGLTEGKHCSVCQAVLIPQEKVKALGHREVKDPAVEPTCAKTGLTAGSHCDVCGSVLVAQEVIGALGHIWDSGKVTKEPTETQKGEKVYTCEVCKDTRVVDIPATGAGHTHTYRDAVTAPTCTEEGYTTHICTGCGDRYTDAFVAALGHRSVTDAAVLPTCTASGKTEGAHCSVCGMILIAQKTIPASDHTWDSGIVTKEPTETQKGEKVYTCEVCGNTRTVEIPATGAGHTHTYRDAVTAPTCTEEGYTTHTCVDCGEWYIDSFVSAIGHKIVTDAAVSPACLISGKTEGKHCSVCGTILLAQRTIPALGHAWDNGKILIEAGVQNEGKKQYTCTACGKTKTETIPALGGVLPVFTDVPAGIWYYDSVYDLVGRGIVHGMTKTTFAPNDNITRAQFAKILAAASGENLTQYGGQSIFVDVRDTDWFAPYVRWAYANGIVKGMSATEFAPNKKITREQMAAMICRYASYKGIDLPKINARLTFKDDSSIGGWAKDNVYAMQQAGIINGYADGNGYVFKPKGDATRAEAARMVSAFLNL